MSDREKPIHVGKLDAARRQLETAIELWFHDSDPVPVHTLAYSAYEIIHVISKKRSPNRRDLLFDTLVIKDEYRAEHVKEIKRSANFFKHADRDGEAVLEFHPALTELFFIFSILGIEFCGERNSDTEAAFIWWLSLHEPAILTDAGKKMFGETIPVEITDDLRRLPKRQFFEEFKQARRAFLRRGR